MNAVRCPNCHRVNQISALTCVSCTTSLANIAATDYVSLPVDQIYPAPNFAPQNYIPEDNELGRKTFFWYRVYCSVSGAFSLIFVALGLFFLLGDPSFGGPKDPVAPMVGAIYLFMGIVLLAVFAVAASLPRKPYNWIVGLVFIALGFTSCCFWPAVIPLLIYWIKPETQAYLGRMK